MADTGNPHDAAKARAFLKRVSEFVDAQMAAGATGIMAHTVSPQEGEMFRAHVTSSILPEPHFIIEHHSENE